MPVLRSLLNLFNRLRYSLYAPLYDPVAGLFAAWRRRSITLLAPLPHERVRLVGAGSGLDLDFLPMQRQLTAVDITPAMIARLKTRAARLGLKVDARVMDGQALDFPDNSFDAVILHLILAVIPDPAACLREVERVLKPGGRVAVFDKFLPDGTRASVGRRLANLVTSLIATSIDRRLGDIVLATHLTKIHDESVGLSGFFRIALLRK
jgi:ubiquinone/menaquinone biosynthesis C-methylase UbiE